MAPERLRQMVDQIARNFAVRGEAAAMKATADHLATFWEPRMLAAIIADDRAKLSPIARLAIDHLAAGPAPASQTPATQFNRVDEIGHGDAG